MQLTPTSYIVLGLLELAGEATPYELKSFLARSVGNVWSVPHSQVYAEPARLARGGYAAERREPAGRRRRVFRLTAAGRAALEAWRREPARELPELRDLALLKLFFGADPALIAPEQAAAHRRKLAEYESLRMQLAADPAHAAMLRTLDAGIGHEREWVRYWEAL